MALKPCKECKKDVSTEAESCPHCGVSYPTGLGAARAIGGCLSFLFGISVLGGLGYYFLSPMIEYSERPDGKRSAWLESFTFSKGYYLNIRNDSGFELLNTQIEYRVSGRSGVKQDIGSLAPNTSVRIDPTKVGWTIDKDQEIHVSNSNAKTGIWQTTELINKLK